MTPIPGARPFESPRGGRGAPLPRSGSRLRAGTWLMHVALPLLALWVLLAQPQFDVAWDNRIAHFALVLGTAVVSVVLGVLMSRAARTRDDARLWLVAYVFVSSSAFLGLHALVTPGLLLDTSDAGFMLPTRVGLLLAATAGLLSAVDVGPLAAARLQRLRTPLTAALWVMVAACAAVVVAGAPLEPVSDAAPVAALGGAVLFTAAAALYVRLYRRRQGVVLLSVLTAFVLLAEAAVALALGHPWHASWWMWHVLMTLAFCFIAYSAHVQFHREGSARGLFDSLAAQDSLAALRRDYAAALEEMVDALRRRERGEPAPVGAVLASRFDLTEQQAAVLERAAEALEAEREQVHRLGCLVAVGRETRIIQRERILLDRLMAAGADAFRQTDLRVGLVRAGELDFDGEPAGPLAQRAVRTREPEYDDGALAVPLLVKDQVAGVIEARPSGRRLADAEVALLRTFANQVSTALENARLYHQLDGMFRSYLSPAVATALLADPEQAGLGGAVVEVTVLMADLRGFTAFAEATEPDEVVAMLNAYYGVIVPLILEEGGTVVQFVGDAVMAIWNAPVRQPDHAERAARAGLALHGAVDVVAAGHDGWPRFRVGVNTGPALVGNIGSEQLRNFTAIGDTTNLAARLQSLAEAGEVVLGPATRERLADGVRVSNQGEVSVKGRREPVPVWLLDGWDS
ncbi:MAG: GAF domain-containing protein [Actinomycetota bacterium]|nr:GAF domain-containing protein [Actinomycetota bacterium]